MHFDVKPNKTNIMTQRELKARLQYKLYRLARLLSEYEQFLEHQLSSNIQIEKVNVGKDGIEDYRYFVIVEFYNYTILERDDGNLEAYRNSKSREFEFSVEGLDKAIDRWRKKIAREIAKRNGVEIPEDEDPVLFDEEMQKPIE